MSECNHKFQYQGFGYYHATTPSPGTAATQRYYVDVYFCERCLTRVEKNKIAMGNSYEKVIQGAIPIEV